MWFFIIYKPLRIHQQKGDTVPRFKYLKVCYALYHPRHYRHMGLTHWGRVTASYMCPQINHNWFRQWLAAWPAPSHYLNQCWNIVNWTLRNKLQGNLHRNSYIFIQENPFENFVCKMAAIFSRPQCVKIISVYWLVRWIIYIPVIRLYLINTAYTSFWLMFDFMKAFDKVTNMGTRYTAHAGLSVNDPAMIMWWCHMYIPLLLRFHERKV